MEPIPESLDVLRQLSVPAEKDLVGVLQRSASRVAEAIPDCVAVSIAYLEADLTFTLIATSDRLRAVDAAQYLEGGPCQAAALDGEVVDVEDVLDEDRWQLFAQATAAYGVRSSLSLPLRKDGRLYGSINFYGGTTCCFMGRERELAVMFGASVEDAVSNADLGMSSVARAQQAGVRLHNQDTINKAVGVLAARERISVEKAHERLREAARRADMPVSAVAEMLLDGLSH